jgi:hypothetical protein
MIGSQIIDFLLEADDEDFDASLKDILGGGEGENLLGPPTPEYKEVGGYIDRHDRWASVGAGDATFCVSYLTPVAVYISGQGVKATEKRWGQATLRHIFKWAQDIGVVSSDTKEKQAAFYARLPKIPQAELIQIFKEHTRNVRWKRKDVKAMDRIPYAKMRSGLKSGSEERIGIRVGGELPDEP